MKVVMDTNVVLAAMIKPSGLAALLIKALDGDFLMNYTSEEALHELSLKIGLLAEKGRLSSEWKRILARYLRGSITVLPSREFNISRDPEDNKWLEIAYEGKVEYILTWDDDLIALRDENKVVCLEDHALKILRPLEFYHEVLKQLC
ncbi:putative toxin-antitoxin system toxin component, PIN family [Thermococcus sp. M36]|uniref:putative toxin-antitoxin system toxin component, PIN family n=1 Tax=Thermococcus sp. M36 TaxID=1638261 RepID=UPI001439E50E|nr:putative toxin-antitoxin system toxin component, PIN family [Thermococcus sp. M36]NJE05731.1 putative toxin-antitoxin system toxin component, PIN family [Thermococcus sp. M36]